MTVCGTPRAPVKYGNLRGYLLLCAILTIAFFGIVGLNRVFSRHLETSHPGEPVGISFTSPSTSCAHTSRRSRDPQRLDQHRRRNLVATVRCLMRSGFRRDLASCNLPLLGMTNGCTVSDGHSLTPVDQPKPSRDQRAVPRSCRQILRTP